MVSFSNLRASVLSFFIACVVCVSFAPVDSLQMYGMSQDEKRLQKLKAQLEKTKMEEKALQSEIDALLNVYGLEEDDVER